MSVCMTVPQWKRGECTVDGRAVSLPPLWAELLAVLLVNSPDRFVTRETLIEALWPDPDSEPDYAATYVGKVIHFMRRRGVPIENDWGKGWRIPLHCRADRHEPARLAA